MPHIRCASKCSEKTRKSWFEGGFDGTLFDGRIVGSVTKVLQYPTLVKNGKTYECINIDNVQLV